MIKVRLLSLLVLTMFVTDGKRSLDAHPGHSVRQSVTVEDQNFPSGRTWSIDDDTKSAFGSFVSVHDGVVQIRRKDDTLIEIPCERISEEDQKYVELRTAQIHAETVLPLLLTQLERRADAPANKDAPLIANHFDPFVKLKAIQTRWDEKYFYVESNGIPAHQMMVGITAWQQQVPLPQKYYGDNAWQIPLHPVEAKTPASAKNRFLRGAIAVAVNGIPIFNPLNNRGDDAYLFGELDEFGGHCGRADDYHYHLAPVHLEKIVGKGNPIAYALDGYPIYSYQNPKDADFAPLDALNGHKNSKGEYHYHATKEYPYLNGGFHGVVIEKEGQVDPQPRAEPLRPSLTPLKDAKIVGFEETKPGSYLLTYDVKGKKGTVSYALKDNASAVFEFVDTAGRKTTQTYQSRRGGPNRPQPPGSRPKKRPATDEDPPLEKTSRRPTEKSGQTLMLKSDSVDENGMLSIDCTCDGKRQPPAISWEGAPAETRFFAISLWHTAPDQEKSYWLVYNIPASSKGFAQNGKVQGTVGMNDRRKAEFDPMCSKGPGQKTYHLTVFALSKKLDLPAEKVSRASLLDACKGSILAEGTLDFQYERSSK